MQGKLNLKKKEREFSSLYMKHTFDNDHLLFLMVLILYIVLYVYIYLVSNPMMNEGTVAPGTLKRRKNNKLGQEARVGAGYVCDELFCCDD